MRATAAEASRAGAAQWRARREHLEHHAAAAADTTMPAAQGAKHRAARKLVANHVAVLRDAVNPEPRTQHQLTRLDAARAAPD